jgi:hypothetical protein
MAAAVAGASPERIEDLQRDALGAQVGHRGLRVRPQRLGQDDEPERGEVGRRAVEVLERSGGMRRAAEREHPPPGGGLAAAALAEVTEREELRRPEHGRHARRLHRAPAPVRGERHLGVDRAVARRRIRNRAREGVQGLVPTGPGGGVAARGGPQLRRRDPLRGRDVDQPQPPLGQRARLVEADHVD